MTTEIVSRGFGSGSGRTKGSANKIARDIRVMVLEALDYAGGADYLAKQAELNPVAFMGLLAKLLPTTVNSADGSPIAMHLLAAQMMSTELLEQQRQAPPTLNGHAEAATVDLNAPPPTE